MLDALAFAFLNGVLVGTVATLIGGVVVLVLVRAERAWGCG